MVSSSKTTEELINILKMDKSLGDERDLFFSEIKAEPDDNTKTKAIVIYWTYLKWKSQRGGEPIDRRSFFIGLRSVFKHKNTKRNFYYVKSDAFEVDKEEKLLMREHLKQEKRYYREQKRRKKISAWQRKKWQRKKLQEKKEE